MGQVAAYISGKGGTGKTTLCAAVAGSLSKLGKSVLCIDLDVGLRNLDISLGMRDEATVSFLDVMEARCALDDAPQHPLLPGLRLLTAPVIGQNERIDEDGFFELLRQARERFDWVFLDAPAGIGDFFRLAVRRATHSIVVTQADPACLRDAQRAGALAKELGPQWARVVVNRVNPRIYNRLRTNVDDIMDTVGLPLLGLVPEHVDVLLSAAWGVPLCNADCPPAAACRNIARRLEGESVPLMLR